MAVTSCAYALNPISGTSDERNRGTYVVRYRINTDSVMGPKEVAAGAQSSSPNALPAQWDTYAFHSDSDSNAYAQHFSMDLVHGEDSRFEWLCTVTYAPLPEGSGPTWTHSDPFLRGISVWWDREVYTEIIEQDIFSHQIVNTANQPYDEPLEIEASRGVLVIEQNVASLDAVIRLDRQLSGAVNIEAWQFFGLPARTALCREVTSSPLIREGAQSYYRLSFRVAIAPEGRTWDSLILSRGFKHWAFFPPLPGNPVPGPPILVNAADRVIDSDGMATGELAQVTEPVLLDINGFRLPRNQAPVFTSWRIRREVNFDAILKPYGIGV